MHADGLWDLLSISLSWDANRVWDLFGVLSSDVGGDWFASVVGFSSDALSGGVWSSTGDGLADLLLNIDSLGSVGGHRNLDVSHHWLWALWHWCALNWSTLLNWGTLLNWCTRLAT